MTDPEAAIPTDSSDCSEPHFDFDDVREGGAMDLYECAEGCLYPAKIVPADAMCERHRLQMGRRTFHLASGAWLNVRRRRARVTKRLDVIQVRLQNLETYLDQMAMNLGRIESAMNRLANAKRT